jgi:putative ABC transport system permease protein
MPRDSRLFRLLVRLAFPREFRAGYADEMSRTFAVQHREARSRGPRALAALWAEMALDAMRSGPRLYVDQLRQDLRQARRTIARQPGFFVVGSLVLGIGIAAATAIFSIVDAALLRPIPFDGPDRLVAVREQVPQDTRPWELSYPAFLGLREHATTLEHAAASMRYGVTLAGAEPRLTEAAAISSDLLETLRVRPAAGRRFTAAEDIPGAAPVILLRETLARERFGTPEAAVGKTIPVDGDAPTIVGVLPESFRFPGADIDVWMPIGQLAGEPWMRDRAVHVALVIGRLRPGATVAAARAELTAWMDAEHARQPNADPGHRILVRPLASQVSAASRTTVAALGGAVLLLLVVTCSSVGLLLVTRASGRTSEVSVRLSLGATRGRLTRQFLTETACVAAVGTAAGIAGAMALLDYLVHGLADALPPFVVPRINVAALGAAAVTAVVVTLVCGIVPAAAALSFVRIPGAQRHRPRHRLIAVQVAISCVLVVVAALLARSLDRLLRVDPGFRSDHLLLIRVSAPIASYTSAADITRFFETIRARVRTLPGVVAVAAGAPAPLTAGSVGDLHVEGGTDVGGPVATYRRVQPGYFATLGIPLLEGRDFTDRDGAGERVVIISAGVARRFWPPHGAIGRRIKVGSAPREPWLRIVGVVGDVRNQTLEDAPELATYEPHAQRPWNALFVIVRTAGEPTALVSAVRRAIRDLEPQAVLSPPSTMEARMAESIAARRFYTVVVGTFAMTTIVLVALAVYGALSYSVASRRREIGIRCAVGASTAALRRFVVGEGLRPTVAGLAAGLAGGAAAAWFARSLLFDIGPDDPLTYAGVAAFFLLVLAAATWLPARRAARIDPTIALRVE